MSLPTGYQKSFARRPEGSFGFSSLGFFHAWTVSLAQQLFAQQLFA